MKTLQDFGSRSGRGFIRLSNEKRISVSFSLRLRRWLVEGIPGLWEAPNGSLRDWPAAENAEMFRLFNSGESFVLEDSEGSYLTSGKIFSGPLPPRVDCDFEADEVPYELFGIERDR